MNKTLLHCLLFPLTAFSLGACATSSATKPQNPEVVAKFRAIDKTKMATMIVYRSREYFGAALRPTVVFDGKDLVNIGNGKVFVAALSPGHHIFEMDDKKSGTTVGLKRRQDVYVEERYRPGILERWRQNDQAMPQLGNYQSTRSTPSSPKTLRPRLPLSV